MKIYGATEHLSKSREALSGAVHSALVEVFELPSEKRFQRFFPLDREDFLFPEDRSSRYTIIEISVFEGRSVEAKRQLIRALFREVEARAGVAPQDLEITIFETPKANWGIRGKCGDELALNHRVDV